MSSTSTGGTGRTGRVGVPVLIGLGAFLLVAAALMRFYAYPALAVAPADQDSVTRLSATDATLFDPNPEVLRQITTDLSVASTTRADATATEKAPEGDVVWVGTTTVARPDGTIVRQSKEKVAFDGRSGAGVDCCGAFVESEAGIQTPVVRTGQVYKFPFDTQQQDYAFWDSTLGAAAPAKYVGTEERNGVETYRFEQSVQPTVTGQREVPGSILGSREASVDADEVYSVDRTLWVEPTTGMIVDRRDDQTQALRYDGESLTTLGATLAYTDAQVQANADDVRSKAVLLGGLHGLFPAVAAGLGLVLLAGGLLLRRRAGTTSGRSSREQELARV